MSPCSANQPRFEAYFSSPCSVNIMTWHSRTLNIANTGEIACSIKVEMEGLGSGFSLSASAAVNGFFVDPSSLNSKGCVVLQPASKCAVAIRFRSDSESSCTGTVRLTPLLTGAHVSRVRCKAEAALLRVVCLEPDPSIDVGKVCQSFNCTTATYVS